MAANPAPLRIALDATPLTEPSGGIARYTRELSAALAAEFPQDQYWLLSDQVWEGTPPGVLRGEQRKGPLGRRWWSLGLPRELARIGADAFHGTDFAVPYVPLRPSVLTLHDLSPWRSGPERAERAGRIRRRTPLALRAATMVVTPSEAVRQEAIERFRLAPSRVAAVPLAAGVEFGPRSAREIQPTLARLGVRQPYVLFVGTRERRKNLVRLVEAWREARRAWRDLGLVVGGRAGSESLSEEPGLVLTGLLPDADVAALMAGAALFVYPSLYEGFGLPVLEAMQTGTPVVISRDPALVEVAAGAAVTAAAESAAELARAIVDLMGDPARRRELGERGMRRAADFSWRQTAIRTREVYVEALRQF